MNATAEGRQILLLDDDEGILLLERRRLEAAGYVVTTARTPDEARERLRTLPFALLVLDYRLEAGQSGLEFYQQLRAEGRDVPAVLVTAFSDESKLIEALRSGVRDVVPKSGEYLEYLPQAIGRVMAQIAAERQAVETEALRRSEERLRALNAELEQSGRRLRLQADALSEANRSKDLFLATLAHELRNPLAPIRFALTLLTDLPAAQSGARDVIERQLLHLVRLVDDLLDVSRITRGTFHLQPELVRLDRIMREAIESVTPEVTTAEHELALEGPVPDVWLNGDAVRLAQIFTNLLHNAAKYTPRGGRISFSAERIGASVRVSVADSGIGIAAEHLPHVFDLFYRAPDNGEQTPGGLGIGLMLVRQLVELHGGTVEAHSHGAGRGAQFTVSLPVAAAPADVSRSVPAEEARGNCPLRVLVVDDNVDSADLLSVVVNQLGHDTRVAHDGPTAAEAFADFSPQAVLLDIGLPGTDGYTLARRFRAESPNVFLVAITGWGQDEDRRRAREAGFDHHLVKPADPAVIERLLAGVADG